MGKLLSDNVEPNKNVRSVCLASRSTVRVSGGLKNSWGRVVGRHSSVIFLSCYSHQTALNNQSLFAEIRIGLHWNVAQHSASDKISQNTGKEGFLVFTAQPNVCRQSRSFVYFYGLGLFLLFRKRCDIFGSLSFWLFLQNTVDLAWMKLVHL